MCVGGATGSGAGRPGSRCDAPAGSPIRPIPHPANGNFDCRTAALSCRPALTSQESARPPLDPRQRSKSSRALKDIAERLHAEAFGGIGRKQFARVARAHPGYVVELEPVNLHLLRAIAAGLSERDNQKRPEKKGASPLRMRYPQNPVLSDGEAKT